MKADDLRTRVHAALNNAAQGGYASFVMGDDPELIANDLVDCYDDVAGEVPGDLIVHVREWQSRRRDAMS